MDFSNKNHDEWNDYFLQSSEHLILGFGIIALAIAGIYGLSLLVGYPA